MKKINYFFLCFFFFFGSCSTSHDIRPPEIEFLYLPSVSDSNFKVSQPNSIATELNNLLTDDFELGDIPGSKKFYFVIKNKGDITAKNITLNVISKLDGISFDVAELDSVPPFNTLDLNEILQNYLVKLSITHRSSSNDSLDTAQLLPMGSQSIELSATEGQNNSITTANATFTVLLADLKAYDENGEVDLYKAGWAIIGGFEAGTAIPSYRISQNAKVVNSGNVNLPIQLFDSLYVPEDFILQPGKEIEFKDHTDIFIAIKQTSAVRDYQKFPIVSNNKCYLGFFRR